MGQQTEFRPRIGVGNYSMSGLKGMLQESVKSLPFDLKTTENFPTYVFYGMDMIHCVTPNFGMGITSGFYSTGGRNHYADYSGSYREDFLVNSINIGLLATNKDTLGAGFFYTIEFASGIKFSSISIEQDLKLSDYQEDTKTDLSSKGLWIEPQIRFGRNLFPDFSCSLFVGY